jgi:hypothetical protein
MMEAEMYHFGFALDSAIVKLNVIAITGGRREALGYGRYQKIPLKKERSSQGILG